MVAKIWKNIAIAISVVEIIGFLIMAILVGNFLFVVLGVVSGLLSGLSCYTIGEIVEQLEISNHNTYEIHRLLKTIAPEEEQKEKKSYFSAPSAPVAKKSSTGDWICKKCNAKNESGAISCRDCGSYR